VLDLAIDKAEQVKKLGRDGATQKLVDKYRDRKIRSVIHFRRIMESYESTEEDKVANAKVIRRIEQFFVNPKLETREAFDEFIADKKRVQNALSACDTFLTQLRKFTLRYTADDEERSSLRRALIEVRAYCDSLEERFASTTTNQSPWTSSRPGDGCNSSTRTIGSTRQSC